MWYSAIMMGLAGRLYCLGMCSPLVIAATGTQSSPLSLRRISYNGGRILTYGIQGAAVSSVAALLELSGFQKTISIAMGVMFIVFGMTGIVALRIPVVTSLMNKVTLFFKAAFAHFLSRKSIPSM